MAEETLSASTTPAPSPLAPLLRVEELRTRFHMRDSTVQAVNGVSFKLAPGEALGIVGESGCGKSVSALSLMRLLAEPPAKVEAASVIFDGIDLLALPQDQMRSVRGKQDRNDRQSPR